MFGLDPEHVCNATTHKLWGLATWDEVFMIFWWTTPSFHLSYGTWCMLLERHDKGVVHCHVKICYASSKQVRWIAAVLDPARSGTPPTHPADYTSEIPWSQGPVRSKWHAKVALSTRSLLGYTSPPNQIYDFSCLLLRTPSINLSNWIIVLLRILLLGGFLTSRKLLVRNPLPPSSHALERSYQNFTLRINNS
jgi:hypothetical protein